MFKNGKLVYIPEKVSNKEKTWLDELGIPPLGDKFVIKFETAGGNSIMEQSVYAGKKVTKPSNPIKNDYEFLYWYYYVNQGTESNPNYVEKEFDFNTEVKQDYTLYAKYDGEAIMQPATIDGSNLFWKYRDLITEASIIRVDSISIPETAKEKWEHVERDEKCSQISAYIEDDGTGTGKYKLTICSTKEIFAHAYSDFFFYKFSNLKRVDLSNYNTQKSVSLVNFFGEDKLLEEIKNFNFKTSHVKYMSLMFYNCNKLNKIDTKLFDTEDVKAMYYMFAGCESITNLDLSNFKTNKVINMQGMFEGMSNVTSINIDSFNTDQTTNLSYLFSGCKKLESLKINNINTEKVTNMSYMFQNCAKLKNIDLSSFKTNNVENYTYMFYQCTALENLNITNFNFEKAQDISRMFSYCGNLTTEININAPNDVKYEKIFNGTSTNQNSKVKVNYTLQSTTLVDNIINTKSNNSNVIKGNEYSI